MANMREIKLRMKSIKETRQITKAMKLISASKLKKARLQLEQTMPFFEKVKATIADIIAHSGNIESVYFDVRDKQEAKKKGYIVLTGDKGLAGGYNQNIIKLTEKQLEEDKTAMLFVAGHTGRTFFSRKGLNVNTDFDYPVQNPTTIRAREIGATILEMFAKGELDEVYIVYTKMVSAIKLEPTIMKLLPIEMDTFKGYVKEDIIIDESLTYEPSPKAVIDVLIPKYVKGILYGAFVEAFASEQSARMTAMDNATSNADDMLQRLNLYYNRARQAAITQEISEIVGGAAALQ